MSTSIEIFVDSHAPLEDFALEIESLLGIPLERFSDEWETWYEFGDEHITLMVIAHEYENSQNIHFEDYRYDIEVRALNTQTEAECEKWRGDSARSIFQKLKELNKYPLMMVEDLGVKLDQFDPVPTVLA